MHTQKRNAAPYHMSHAISVARRFLLVSALAAIAGCETPRPLVGDPARPLMAPGEGALVLGMVLTSPMPEGLRMRGLTTFVDFEPVEGGDEVTVGRYSGPAATPVHVAKLPTPDKDLSHVLFIQSLKPGTYQLKRFIVTEWGRFDFKPGPDNQITVRAGQVTYFGNMDLKYSTRFTAKGDLVVRDLFMDGPTDEFARDTAELKAADKRLESVVFTNALDRKGR